MIHSTMSSKYSMTEILELLDQIIEPANESVFRRATKSLQTLQKSQNFSTEFLELVLHPQLKDNHKLLVLSAIRQHLQFIHRQKFITFAFIDSIFTVWNSCEVSGKCKEVLLHIMSSVECFTLIRQDITRLILQRMQNQQIRTTDYYIIYISQFILKFTDSWTDTVRYLLSMNQVHLAIAKCIMMAAKSNYEELLQVVELFKVVTGKLKYASPDQKQTYLNSQISDFLLDCLDLTQIEKQGEIKTEIFELFGSIFSITNNYLQHTSFYVRTISQVAWVVTHAINFLSRDQTNATSRKNSVPICVSLLYKIYGDINLITQTLGIPVQQLILCLIKSITLKNQHYDHFHFNPTQFLNFIRSILQIQKVKSTSNMQDCSKDQQEELGLPRKSDGRTYMNISRPDKQKQDDEYFHICQLIELICRKNQSMGVGLLKSIVETLTIGVSFDGLQRTTSWILLGLLKRQVIKRGDILSSVRQIILAELFESAVPTVNSQQPENMQFTIALAVAEKYLDVVFEGSEDNARLFGLLMHIVEGRKREESLVCLAVDMLKEFVHKTDYFELITAVLSTKIESSDSQIILVQIVGFHQQLINYFTTITPDIGKQFHKAILLISRKIDKWMRSQKLQPVTFSALQLLFQYKHFLNYNPSFSHSYTRYDQLIQQFRRIRYIINIWKDGALRSTFDSYFFSSFCNDISIRNRIQNERQEELMLAIIDYNTANRANQFVKEGKRLIQLIANRSHTLSNDLKKKMPAVLIMLFQSVDSQQFYEILQIAQSFVVMQYGSIDSSHCQRLLACINEHISNLWEMSSNMTACWLTIQVAVYLAAPHLVNPRKLVQKLVANSSALSSSPRNIQISIYLISLLMQRLIVNSTDCQNLQLLHLVISLINKSISDEFQDRMTIQSSQRDNILAQKLQIDEWEPLKSLICHLRHLELWQHLRNSLSVRQRQILRRSMLCCNMQKQTRLIYKIHSSTPTLQVIANKHIYPVI